MEKNSVIGYVLIFFLFIGFYFFSKQNQEELTNQKVSTEDSVETTPAPADTAQVSYNDSVSIALDTNLTETITTLRNDLLEIDFSSIGGTPIKVTLTKFKRYDSSALVLFDKGQTQLGYTIPLANGASINTLSTFFETQIIGDSQVVMTANLLNNARIVQTYTLSPNSYNVDYKVNFEGIKDIISPNNRYAVLDWSSAIQGQEKTVEDERSVSTVYYSYAQDEDVDYLSETSDDEEKLQANVQWVAFKQKFFNQTLISNTQFSEQGIQIEVKTPENEAATYVKDVKAQFFIPLEQNSVLEDMDLYYGPNHYPTLKEEGIGLQKMIPLGWGIFGWVNKGLVIPIFNWLNQYFTNYGLIIILLTLIIKLALFFPMFKVYKSTAKMKLLKPELDEIKTKTGDDMAKAQQEQMKLYKQAGVSPLGGCLPQLVQMPILFAMFRFFPSSIELRQKSFLWAEDLSSYDSIFDFPNGFEIPFYGDHVSLFTLLMTAVTILYTYINSQSTSQMVGPMKTMMYIMPIMFLGFFNNYAAALSFYYFLSTCFTILLNFIIRKFVIDEDRLHQQIQENKKKKIVTKKSGLQKRLEDMAKKRGIDPKSGRPAKNNKK